MSERLKDFDQAIDIMVHNYQWMIDSEKRSKTELHAKNYADYREFIVEAYKKALERAETLERLREEDSTYYNELLTKLREQNERYKQALEFYADEDNYCVSFEDDYEPILQDNGDTARQALGQEERK